MNEPAQRVDRGLLGPVLVIAGASMWGLETFWRLRLSEHFAADVLVFHEHWLGLLLTAPFLALGFRKLAGVSRKAWLSMAASGVLGSALGTVCFTRALTLMNPSVANLLLNLQPLVSVAVTWFWLGERPRPAFYPWAALAIACGVGLAWDPQALGDPGRLALGLLFIAGTAFCWGASTTMGRAAMLEIDFKTGVALRYLIGTVATFGVMMFGGVSGERLNFGALFSRPVLSDMLQLLVAAAITPTFLYFAGLARTRASVATFAEMAQTFASLLITWGTLGHALSPLQFASGVVLLVAIAAINRSVDEQERARELASPVTHPAG